jgi:hypothetical protein
MGDRIRGRSHRRRLAAGACALVLLLPIAAAWAQRVIPPREPATKGNIVGFEESASTRILYLEETGGMVTQVARPPSREASEEPTAATATAAKASPPADKSRAEAAARRAPRRSAAVTETAGTRP